MLLTVTRVDDYTTVGNGDKTRLLPLLLHNPNKGEHDARDIATIPPLSNFSAFINTIRQVDYRSTAYR
jgi:hypothetical protein